MAQSKNVNVAVETSAALHVLVRQKSNVLSNGIGHTTNLICDTIYTRHPLSDLRKVDLGICTIDNSLFGVHEGTHYPGKKQLHASNKYVFMMILKYIVPSIFEGMYCLIQSFF